MAEAKKTGDQTKACRVPPFLAAAASVEAQDHSTTAEESPEQIAAVDIQYELEHIDQSSDILPMAEVVEEESAATDFTVTVITDNKKQKKSGRRSNNSRK